MEHLVRVLKKDFLHYGKVQNHHAGTQLVFHLSKSLKDTEVSIHAQKAGLILEPLSKSTARDLSYNGFILGFCNYSEGELLQALTTFHSLLVELSH
ncbi:hypothetical protein [Zooshikella ganghwensis]|uniref:hypothetical protein n=1 Tax=Zooshikella ganghwensis TaxID=202772 RepID=UPI0003F5EC13|nr:hypothetical protein [Zooshikella ganghwensis]